ncbi:MAG: hypothetical protein RLZZ479_247 [Bacteroidota bacterium]|jgi:hypothetical protein
MKEFYFSQVIKFIVATFLAISAAYGLTLDTFRGYSIFILSTLFFCIYVYDMHKEMKKATKNINDNEK